MKNNITRLIVCIAAALAAIHGFADAPPIPHSPESSPSASSYPVYPIEPPPPPTSSSSSSSSSSESESDKLARYLRQDTDVAKDEADKTVETLDLTVEAAADLEPDAAKLTKLTDTMTDIQARKAPV